jgi:ribosomal protein S10
MEYKLEILIKSFEQQLVNKATKQLVEILHLTTKNRYDKNSIETLNSLHFFDQKVFYFPKSMKKFTVIRSPHIDKKARDQFQIQEFKNLVQFKLKSYLNPLSINKNNLVQIDEFLTASSLNNVVKPDLRKSDFFDLKENKNCSKPIFDSTFKSKGKSKSFLCFSFLENLKSVKFIGVQMQIKIHSTTFGPA